MRTGFGTLLLAVVSLVGAISTTSAGAAGAPRQPQRAVWVWNNWVASDPERRDDLIAFCRQRGINVLFLHVLPEELSVRSADFRAFLTQAHEQGFKVQALAGAPEWVFADKRERLSGFLAAVLKFNQEGPAEARFEGIHLDVEPYDTAEWKAGPAAVGKQYLEMLEFTRARIGALPLAADVPPWYSTVEMDATAGRSLLAAVVERVDQIGLMAYARQVRDIGGSSRYALEAARRQGKGVWVGMSAQLYDSDMKRDQPLRAQVENVVKSIEKRLKSAPGLLGIAIHDYEHYRPLYPAGAARAKAKSKTPGAASTPAAAAGSAAATSGNLQ
ncbi:MAG: hypothetical protein M3P27_09925 [Acidobacteriota bacterium]|nr:hypothetical protein [Acidobacteriota bacterium]